MIKVDPSKFVHGVKKLDKPKDLDDREMSRSKVTDLTWELEENQSENYKKRKGEFPEYSPPKKKLTVKHSSRSFDTEDDGFEVVSLQASPPQRGHVRNAPTTVYPTASGGAHCHSASKSPLPDVVTSAVDADFLKKFNSSDSESDAETSQHKTRMSTSQKKTKPSPKTKEKPDLSSRKRFSLKCLQKSDRACSGEGEQSVSVSSMKSSEAVLEMTPGKPHLSAGLKHPAIDSGSESNTPLTSMQKKNKQDLGVSVQRTKNRDIRVDQTRTREKQFQGVQADRKTSSVQGKGKKLKSKKKAALTSTKRLPGFGGTAMLESDQVQTAVGDKKPIRTFDGVKYGTEILQSLFTLSDESADETDKSHVVDAREGDADFLGLQGAVDKLLRLQGGMKPSKCDGGAMRNSDLEKDSSGGAGKWTSLGVDSSRCGGTGKSPETKGSVFGKFSEKHTAKIVPDFDENGASHSETDSSESKSTDFDIFALELPVSSSGYQSDQTESSSSGTESASGDSEGRWAGNTESTSSSQVASTQRDTHISRLSARDAADDLEHGSESINSEFEKAAEMQNAETKMKSNSSKELVLEPRSSPGGSFSVTPLAARTQRSPEWKSRKRTPESSADDSESDLETVAKINTSQNKRKQTTQLSPKISGSPDFKSPRTKNASLAADGTKMSEFSSGLNDTLSPSSTPRSCSIFGRKGSDHSSDSEEDLLDLVSSGKVKKVKEYEKRAVQQLPGKQKELKMKLGTPKTPKGSKESKHATMNEKVKSKEQKVVDGTQRREILTDKKEIGNRPDEQTKQGQENSSVGEKEKDTDQAREEMKKKPKTKNEKHAMDNEKRLESLKQKELELRNQKDAIKRALSTVVRSKIWFAHRTGVPLA